MIASFLHFITAVDTRDREYHLSRKRIEGALRRAYAGEVKTVPAHIPILQTETVKNMPAYDPDAEVASLTLTIPSWKRSIERVRASANMQKASAQSKASLRSALEMLRFAIEEMLFSIQED